MGSWIALIAVGLVWGLMFWVIAVYRRRSDDEVPVQTRYNLPLEIFYTIAPIIMVLVFFASQHRRPAAEITELSATSPTTRRQVVGQQWSWTFNYADEDGR